MKLNLAVTITLVNDNSSSIQVWYSFQHNHKVWIHRHSFSETNLHNPIGSSHFGLAFLGHADTDECWTSTARMGSPWEELWHWWRDHPCGSSTECECSCHTRRLEALQSVCFYCYCSRHPIWCVLAGNLSNEWLRENPVFDCNNAKKFIISERGGATAWRKVTTCILAHISESLSAICSPLSAVEGSINQWGGGNVSQAFTAISVQGNMINLIQFYLWQIC